MIIARAPLRVSLGGGGTDLSAYYKEFGGAVLSITINKYIYVVVEDSRSGVHITSPDLGPLQANRDSTSQTDLNHRLPLLVAEQCAPGAALHIFIAGEVPSGTGLGSSSALTVALVTALGAFTGTSRCPEEIAALACNIEIDQLGSPIGKQDQYASAVGGLNVLTFNRDHAVEVAPLSLPHDVRSTLEQRLLLFFTGNRRDAGGILAHQRRQSAEGDPRTLQSLHAIKALALDMVETLRRGDLDRVGQLLHESWMQKRQVTEGISTGYIDHCYEIARQAGAIGGKITGAGGGGFLLLYCDESRAAHVTDALVPIGLVPMPFEFTARGAHVVVREKPGGHDQWP